MAKLLKENFIGKTFGLLTITDVLNVKKGKTIAKYVCKCGKIGENILSMIKVGHVKSCGCLVSQKNTKRIIINDFSENSPETAYWAGFLFGDGSVDKQGAIQVCLSSLTEHTVDHLRKLSNFVYGKDYVLVYDTTCVLQIRHSEVAKNLAKYGIIPNKTYYGKIILPDKYPADFIRGIFDADGWFSNVFYMAHNGKYYQANSWGICSYRKKGLLEISKYLKLKNNITKKSNQHLFELRARNRIDILNIIRLIGTKNSNIEYKRKWDKLWDFYQKYQNIEMNPDTNRLRQIKTTKKN